MMMDLWVLVSLKTNFEIPTIVVKKTQNIVILNLKQKYK